MKKLIFSVFIFLVPALFQNPLQAQLYPGGYWNGIEFCNFDNPCTSVHLDTNIPSNIWRIGLTNKVAFLPCGNAIVTDLTNVYPVNNDSYFDIYINNIANYAINPVISFDHKYITDSLHDGGYIEFSPDNGLTWKNVIDDSTMIHFFGCDGRLNMYTHADTITGNIPAFTGSSNGWIHTELQWVWFIMTKSILDMEPPPDTLILRFHFKSDSIQNNKPGWIIDNVNVSNCILGDINELYNKNSFLRIFPNPVSYTAGITLLKEQPFIKSIGLYDLTGNCVLKVNNIKADTYLFHKDKLRSGLYFVHVEDIEGIIYSAKIVLN